MSDLAHRLVRFKILLFAVTSVAVGFALFYFSARAQSEVLPSSKPELTEALFSKGKALYQKQCSICHGIEGKGDGTAAYLLYPKPRDFSWGEFRLVSTTEMQATDEDLFQTISRGMPGSAMPPWKFLSEEDRWSLVYYVRYLTELGKEMRRGEITDEMVQKGPSWGEKRELAQAKIDPQTVIQVSNEPPVSDESLVRGRELFIKACAACHGREGKGDGQQVMQDNLGYPLKPRDLSTGIFKGSSSSQDLYYRIAAGLPGSPMPGYQAALTDEQIWDLIHYMQTLPQAGAEERARLNRHQIAVHKTDQPLGLNPLGEEWLRVEPVFISLTPLWWRDERVEGIEVKALHDGAQIAVHLSWKDPTQDQTMVAPQSFSDGVAIQLSREKDPPFFAMGSQSGVVTIWHWKTSWEQELQERPDIETEYPNTATDWYESQTNYEYGSPFETRDSKTQFHDPRFLTAWGAGNPLSNPDRKLSSEEAQAKGFGTLTTGGPFLDPVESKGIWQDGKWQVVFRRTLFPKEEGRLQLKPGSTFNVAFAVWDGAKGDRNGQKMVSIWNEFTLEQ